MNFLIQFFGKLVIRRLSYVIAPFLVGWASNNWWIQDLFKSWNFDPNNIDAVTAAIVGSLAVLWMLLNEYVAWRRNRQNKNLSADFHALIADMYASGELQNMAEKISQAASPVAKALLNDVVRNQEKKDAIDALKKAL